jgi:lipopolysaccharide transport system ATP-binding protein
MPQPAIQVKNISKRYFLGGKNDGTLRGSISNWVNTIRNARPENEFWALKDISFEIEKGDVFGIIGRNGAGKSTLLKILSKITYPSTGSITYRGKIASLLEVGTGFHPELTGRENIFLNGTLLGMTRKEVATRLDEIIDFSGIETFIDTAVKHYSSGMYVRLAFSVAAHLEPDIMIVDEVLAVGDSEFQKKCLGKMDDVSKNYGRTVLFVSHNMSAINTLCNNGLLLEDGKLSHIGDIATVTKYYLYGEDDDRRNFLSFSEKDGAGDDNVLILDVKAVNALGRLSDYYKIDEELVLEINYRVRSNTCNPIPAFHIFTGNGEKILASIDTDKTTKRGVGEYRSVCRVPANFFNEGTYIIGVSVATLSPLISHYKQEHLLTVRIVDVPDAITRNLYSGRFQGVIRPLFSWTTEKTTT